MKHIIQGEITTKTLSELSDMIEQEAHDATCHVSTAESIRARADIIMHLAADMHASAEILSQNTEHTDTSR